MERDAQSSRVSIALRASRRRSVALHAGLPARPRYFNSLLAWSPLRNGLLTGIDIARRTGVAAFVGEGANRWPAVHRLDAARLFRLALEQAPPGSRLHGVAEEGIPMRAIAKAIGEGLGVPARSLTEDEAAQHFAWMAMFVGRDAPTSSALTRDTLEWRPREPDLLTDMRESGYFA